MLDELQIKIATNDKIRGMKLLTKELRNKFTDIYAQDGKGGDSIAFAKLFTPDSSWIWYIVSGEPAIEDGVEVDFTFFGLVDGHEKEIGYFSFNELASLRGPLGLPIERDLHFKPTTLREIAPEKFREENNHGY